MKYILLITILFCHAARAQSDENTISGLKEYINYLADDRLEGRRTGTAGEKLAYEYIEGLFKKNGLAPAAAGKTFIQDFEVREGLEIKNETVFFIDGKTAAINKDYFPFAFSANVENLKFKGKADSSILFYDLKNVLEENKTNPHFDLKDHVYNTAKSAALQGKKCCIFQNSSAIADNLTFDARDKTARLQIPVIFLKQQISSAKSMILTINIAEKQKTGHNVIGYIDNKAAATIILGAHYDHLGYGEDHNSLYSGTTAMIHNGADDNASGTAALIELGGWLKKSSLTKYNYLFIAFSGEELGLYGSKFFTSHSPVDLRTVNYMLNMDMVGRLDSSHGLTIGGYGTSPAWQDLVKKEAAGFKIKFDSSGAGPSDHTSFYQKDIPVLFFFTGAHSDYHKPSDDADKINYAGTLSILNYIKTILTNSNQKEKLVFTKTRDIAAARSSFKVTLGIMPDYTFEGSGVRVDGVSAGRPAEKAGIQTGDVLLQLGDHPFNDVQTYMQALNKFNKGEGAKLKFKRGNSDMEANIIF